MAPRAAFTTLHFLCNLRMGPIARVLHYTRVERLAMDKHSSLLDSLINCEDNEVLRIWPLVFLSFLACKFATFLSWSSKTSVAVSSQPSAVTRRPFATHSHFLRKRGKDTRAYFRIHAVSGPSV